MRIDRGDSYAYAKWQNLSKGSEANMAKTYGWMGKFLWVDLSSGKIWEEDTGDYGPAYIGGRGIEARLAWEHIPPKAKPQDEENKLFIFTGPLTGTTAPFSGRLSVAGLSPQVHPYEWYTYSGMGGHWGPELKYSGYDGIVIAGKAAEPVYLWIEDGKAEIRDARSLWGLGTYAAQETLMAEHGQGVRVMAIGPAGENLSRLAIINTETEAAAGQGGFGAVMGGKKLKAIAVKGSGSVAIARPEEFLRQSNAIAREVRECGYRPLRRLNPDRAARYGAKYQACTQQCTDMCALYYQRVPGVLNPEVTYCGQMHCVGGLFPGIPSHLMYNWDLGFPAGFEIGKMANDYGLNHWELLLGVMPWLRAMQEAGELAAVDGIPINLNEPCFWAETMRKISFREGMGEALSEGGVRAAELLGVGKDLIPLFYTAWGFAGHWDGHQDYANYVVFPYWLVSALQWALSSRDPFSSGHGYSQSIMRWCPLRGWGGESLTWEELISVGEKVYGTRDAVDPKSGYQDKAIPAFWHSHRSILKDSAPADDQTFPRVFSLATEDRLARADGMLGPQFEQHLLISATGAWETPEEIDVACERIFNLERAIHMRSHGRSRKDDETVIPAFEWPEVRPNPVLGEKKALDRDKFLKLMDEYYELRGWDKEAGWPRREKLEELGLADVAEDLAKLGLLPDGEKIN